MTVRAFVTYSILRIMVFLGCLSALYLLGLREAKHLPWLAVGAAVLSVLVSAVVLRPFRRELEEQLTARSRARAERAADRAPAPGSDEAAKDDYR